MLICFMFTGKDCFDVKQLVDTVYDIEEEKIDIDEIEEDKDEIIDDTDEGKYIIVFRRNYRNYR